jgi:uncharacterized protein
MCFSYQITGSILEQMARNVLGTTLEGCGDEPTTGFFRTGDCSTGEEDRGLHVVCAEMTREFLAFTQSRGNDLSTPRPEYGFPGLEPGDRWCLCALRWREALIAGIAPPIVLSATEEAALEVIELHDLREYAVDL